MSQVAGDRNVVDEALHHKGSRVPRRNDLAIRLKREGTNGGGVRAETGRYLAACAEGGITLAEAVVTSERETDGVAPNARCAGPATPAAMIAPLGWTASAKGSAIGPVGPKSVTTSPRLPKVASRVPFEL